MTVVGEPPVRGQLLHQLVAAEVRAWMGRRRVTGESLAEQLGTSGTFVSRRLRGKTSFDLDDLERIARVLGVEVETILAPALAEHRRTAPAPAVAGVPAGTVRTLPATKSDEKAYEINCP